MYEVKTPTEEMIIYFESAGTIVPVAYIEHLDEIVSSEEALREEPEPSRIEQLAT